MLIIRQGKNAQPYMGRWGCKRCECVWILDSTDNIPYGFSPNETTTIYNLNCPSCNTRAEKVVNHAPNANT